MDVPTPPSQPFCASCTSQLTWLWSPSKEAWVAFVPVPGADRWTIRPHPCRHAQDPQTWRELPHGDPPNDLYREVKSKITTKGTGS